MFFGALVLSVEYILIFILKGILNHSRYLMSLIFFYIMCLTFLVEGTPRFFIYSLVGIYSRWIYVEREREFYITFLYFSIISEAPPLPGSYIWHYCNSGSIFIQFNITKASAISFENKQLLLYLRQFNFIYTYSNALYTSYSGVRT